jgi:serum/glucocorticoid-regulated kinase 2
LLFSDKVKKINMFGWNQERIIVITTEFIYNIKKNKPKRKIPISLLGGVSKTVGGNKTEFTIHVPT